MYYTCKTLRTFYHASHACTPIKVLQVLRIRPTSVQLPVFFHISLHYGLCASFTGMLSKAKGQVLRTAAAMSVLFSDSLDDDGTIVVSSVHSTISTRPILAAENFVDMCCQHAAYIAGRGKLEDEINRLTSTGRC